MNKELENWINENNPAVSYDRFLWSQGAMEMADHLQSQPPTDEQIDRFLALYNEYCHVPSAALKLYPTAKDYIKAKW